MPNRYPGGGIATPAIQAPHESDDEFEERKDRASGPDDSDSSTSSSGIIAPDDSASEDDNSAGGSSGGGSSIDSSIQTGTTGYEAFTGRHNYQQSPDDTASEDDNSSDTDSSWSPSSGSGYYRGTSEHEETSESRISTAGSDPDDSASEDENSSGAWWQGPDPFNLGGDGSGEGPDWVQALQNQSDPLGLTHDGGLTGERDGSGGSAMPNIELPDVSIPSPGGGRAMNPGILASVLGGQNQGSGGSGGDSGDGGMNRTTILAIVAAVGAAAYAYGVDK